MHLCFYDNFHTLTKKKKKLQEKLMKKLSQFSKVHISETLGLNLDCEMVMMTDISTTKIVWFGQGITELHVQIIVLPVNNSQVWCVGLLSRTTHCCVS